MPQALARDVAEELTKKDALGTHLAEELGISEVTQARPLQAAIGSAGSFTVGAAIPLITVAVASSATRISATLIIVTIGLAGLGYTSAKFGKADVTKPTFRVVIGGLAAMAITMAVGSLFGTVV